MIHSIVAVTVPVTLGVLVSDVASDFGRHRNTLHNGVLLGSFVVFPFVFGPLQYVWIGVGTHFILDRSGAKRGFASFYPFNHPLIIIDHRLACATASTIENAIAPV